MRCATLYSILLFSASFFVVLGTGCSSASSAPFHMYSSPLLEGETEGSTTRTEREEAPGVEPRQIYAYQRWHPEGRTLDDVPDIRRAGTFDTVEPPSRPVLASYQDEHPDENRTATDGTAGPPRDENDREVSSDTELDDEPAGSDATSPDADLADDQPDDTPASDAAGFIHDILSVNDIEVPEETATSIPKLYRECRSRGETFHTGRPDIGDLVFFHNTYDANDDGRNNDWYTLVGIVEDIRPDGTVDFLAYHRQNVDVSSMNLDNLDRHRTDDGELLNSRLRTRRADDPPFTQYLAGQLFAGYCDLFGDRTELILIDDWAPDADIGTDRGDE